MSDEFISVGAVRLFAKVHYKDPHASWLVFSNSLMTDHTVWDAQVELFAGQYNILVYDQRGHGRSEVSRAVTFDDLSRDLLALLDHYDIPDCTFIGLSMGVPTGLGLIGLQPRRVRRLVLADGQMAAQPTARDVWQTRIDTAREVGMHPVAADTVARWFASDFVERGGASKLRDAAAAMSVEGYCASATALQGYDCSAVAGKLDVPVLLIAGANDGAMPGVMAAMAQVIPGAQLEVIPAAGHIPNLEQPEHFNSALAAFLAT